MARRIIILLLLLNLPIWSGCAGVRQGRPARASYQYAIVKTLTDKYSKPDAIPADQTKITEKERNQILDDLIFLTDVNYYRFEAELSYGRAAFDTVTDLAILGLGSAGALVTHSGTQAIISAISGGIGGARVSISKNFLHETSTQALIAKMQSARKAKLDLIRQAMTLNVTDYSLTRGLGDVAEYYTAGTIVGALQNIVSDAGAEAKKADASLADTIKHKYLKEASGDILRNFWKPDATNIDAGNEAKLKAWMKKNQLENVSITSFLYGDIFSEARAKAVTDLKLSK
ncbi:MAG: hypothetical protein ABSH06_16015 [Thermodesulfobacteriota bacterium]